VIFHYPDEDEDFRLAVPEPGTERVAAHAARWDVMVNPVLLFRFSALTCNSHRIHYDREYARDVKGYAGLVVHGPLQAVLMTELARQTAGPERCEFSYRLVSPLLEGQGMVVTGVNEDGEGRMAVQDATGRRTASGTICKYSE
jgi:3-methylfumaryl-CoA hydratase